MDSDRLTDLGERVAHLEAQVRWLIERQYGLTKVGAPPAQSPTGPASKAASRQPISPTVWIAGIGAAIFLMGAIFFFRWAVQQGWVGAPLRFALGLLAGGALSTFASRRLLLDDRRFGVALLLAGIGTLQFTFRVGAIEYQFYSPIAGLALTALVTLSAGVLAARGASGGTLAVALVSGLVAPVEFRQQGHHEVGLAVYLAVLMAATLAIPYLTRRGASWSVARWTALAGVWLMLVVACADVTKPDAAAMISLLVLHLALAGLWAWLPGVEELPATPTPLWIVASILATASAWLLWRQIGFAPELFALPVLGASAMNLALVTPLRRRMGTQRADWGVMALAAGHLALAAPIALAWRWVGPLWGVFATALAWASQKAEGSKIDNEAPTLRWLSAGMAVIATVRWSYDFIGAFFGRAGVIPLFNAGFAEGTLAAAAWFLLMQRGGALAQVSFLALEATANVTLALESARALQWLRPPLDLTYGPTRAASVVITLAWALSGACQWMRGLGQRSRTERALIVAGYSWMAIAGLKLVVVDLDRADTPLRAAAFLGVGGIGMAAAIMANRRRAGEPT